MVPYRPFLGLISLFFVCLQIGFDDALQIKITPNNTDAISTDDVNITCTTTDINVTSIVVLQIIKDGGNPLVFYDPSSGTSLGSPPPKSALPDGGIDNVLNQVYVKMTLTDPKPQDSGVYTCKLIYYYKDGYRTVKESGKLSVAAFDISILKRLSQRLSLLEIKDAENTKEIRALKRKDAENTQKLITQAQEISALKRKENETAQNLSAHSDEIKFLKTENAELKQRVANHSQDITEIKNKDAGFDQELISHSDQIDALKAKDSDVLKNKDYLLEIDAKLSNNSEEINRLKQTGAGEFRLPPILEDRICELKNRNVQILEKLSNHSHELTGLQTKVNEAHEGLSILYEASKTLRARESGLLKSVAFLHGKATSLDCDFEHNLCGWTQSTDDQFDWTRNKGLTSSSFTGPNTDHSGGGFYLYIDSSNKQRGNAATIISPSILIRAGQHWCFKMWYQMYGKDVDRLRVFIKYSKTTKQLWGINGDQGKHWHPVTIDLANLPVTFNFLVTATAGYGPRGDIAIDDISMTRGPCDGTPSSKCDLDKDSSCIVTPRTKSK